MFAESVVAHTYHPFLLALTGADDARGLFVVAENFQVGDRRGATLVVTLIAPVVVARITAGACTAHRNAVAGSALYAADAV